MRILHTECSPYWGGQERRTLREALWLRDHGHSCWIACHPGSVLYQRGSEQGLAMVPLALHKAWRIDSAVKLWAFCRTHRIDVINTHGSRDSTLCALAYAAGIPVVRSRHYSLQPRKAFSYRYGCSHVIAVAEAIKTQLVEVGVPAQRITVMGGSVDLQEFSPDGSVEYLRQEFNLQPNEPVIVNIGMIRGDKGQRYFLEAAEMLFAQGTTARFFLVGAASDDQALEQAIRARVQREGLSERFIMTGYRDDVAGFVRLADIVVVASVNNEAQSQVVPQSFAARRCVVSTDIGGLRELVKHEETGLLVPPADATALAAALRRVLADQGLRNTLADGGYGYAIRHLSSDALMQRMLRLYERLLTPCAIAPQGP